MDLDIKGKTALVTGASRGIGRAIATLFAEEGCNLVLVARDRDGLKTLSSELKQRAAVSVEFEACDLSQAEAPERLAARFPSVDILVNNAGAVPPGKLVELPVEQIKDGWTLKVFGYLGMMRTYFPVMTSRGSGVIVNVIGMAGERVTADAIALTGGNAALIAMTRALGAASPAHGVRVLGVNPARTATQRATTIWRKEAVQRFGDEERWPELVRALPFGRAAEPEEIANVVVFLASPRASYVSGSIVNVDGGFGARP